MGNYHLAKDVLGRIMLPPEDERSHKRFGLPYLPSVFARNFLVRSLAELGEIAIGHTLAKEGVRIAETLNQPWDRVVARFCVGALYLRQGKYQEAISVLEHALSLLQNTNFSEWLGSTAAKLVSAYALSGRATESLSVPEQDMKRRVSRGQMGRLSLLIRSLGEAYLLDGRVQDAIDQSERSLNLARAHKEQGYEAWSLRLLGDIALHRDPPDIDQAETHYQQALALANELGMRPLQAHCHRGLGTLYSQTGQLEQARAELSAAIDMYRDMEMTFWLPETEAAMAEVEGR
jgi:tetratricopeptide (TPR) repeat protein